MKKGNFYSRQVNLSKIKAETIKLELAVIDQNKQYIVVISLDKNPDLRKKLV